MEAVNDVLLYSILLIFPAAFAFRNNYQLSEMFARATCEIDEISNADIYNLLWHKYQTIVQICYLVLIYIIGGALLAAAAGFTYWILFDSLMGYLLTGKVSYLGEYSKLDVITKKLGERLVWIVKLLLAIISWILFILL